MECAAVGIANGKHLHCDFAPLRFCSRCYLRGRRCASSQSHRARNVETFRKKSGGEVKNQRRENQSFRAFGLSEKSPLLKGGEKKRAAIAVAVALCAMLMMPGFATAKPLFHAKYDSGGYDADFGLGDTAGTVEGEGISLVEGVEGKAVYSETDSHGYIEYSALDNFDFDQGTVEMWLKLNPGDDLWHSVFAVADYIAGGGDKTHSTHIEYCETDWEWGPIWVSFYDGINEYAIRCPVKEKDYTSDTWFHFAYVWDEDAAVDDNGSHIAAYINGVKNYAMVAGANEATKKWDVDTTKDDKIRVGEHFKAEGRYGTGGAVDEIWIDNTILTLEQFNGHPLAIAGYGNLATTWGALKR